MWRQKLYHQRVTNASREALERSLGVALREYSPTEVEDFSFRMRNAPWGEVEVGEIIPTLPEDCQRFIFNEIQMSKISWRYWAERHCRIVDDKGRLTPLKLWPSQEDLLSILSEIELKEWEYFSSHPEMREFSVKLPIILLKSRQVGGTVVSQSLLSHLVCLFSHTRAIIASDHPDNSVKLSRVFMGIVDNLPPWMKPIQDAKVKGQNYHFSDIDSDVMVGSGNQKTSLGQSLTVDAAHLTEVSTWEEANANAIDEDMKPAFNSSRKHHSFFLIESTGKGGKGNWFADQFEAARRGESRFKGLFVGWFRCPEKWAMRSDGVELTPATKLLAERIERENGVSLTKEQLTWYQTERRDYEGRGKLQEFLQEYPSTVEEAFQTGVRSVFPLEVRSKLRDKCKTPKRVLRLNPSTGKFTELNLLEWLYDPNPKKVENCLLVWENALPGFVYVIGCDVSYGEDGGDSSSIQVLKVGNRWGPTEQVAEWHGNVAPQDVVAPLWLLGHMYADVMDGTPAMVAIESNHGSPGLVTQLDLQKKGYTNFYVFRKPNARTGGWTNEVGWKTTPATRGPLTEMGVNALMKGEIYINSPWVIEEMGSYILSMTASGIRQYTHAPKYHDDRLMALFISLYISRESYAVNLAEQRVVQKAYLDTPKPPERQLNELGLSWEEALNAWEAGIFS